MTLSLRAQIPDFSSYPVYNGDDLGLRYSTAGSNFRIWSPAAEKAELIFYTKGAGGEAGSNDQYDPVRSRNLDGRSERRPERHVLCFSGIR